MMLPWLGLGIGCLAGAIALPEAWRRKVAWLPFAGGVVLLVVQWSAPAGVKILTASLFMLVMVKLCALYERRGSNRAWWVLPYLAPWPGVDTKPFTSRAKAGDDEAGRFAAGWWRMWLGVALFVAVVLLSPSLNDWALGALVVIASLVIVHLGVSYVLTAVYRLAGWPVSPVFDDPWKSRTLVDLWSHRWNRPFVEMNRVLLMPLANRLFGRKWSWVVAFVSSGILHEMAISYPAGAGYGLPLTYFCIQASLIALERKFVIQSGWWVLAAWLLPTPILFPRPFLEGVIAPLARTLHHDASIWLAALRPEVIVVCLGAATLLPVIASVQVPSKLRWREEFEKLSGLNRRIVWVYGAYVLAMIAGLGAFLLAFPAEIVAKERAAVAVVGFGALFWVGRILVDAVAFRPDDWPQGPVMAIGRTALHTLFLALAAGYSGLLLWTMLS